MFSFLLSVHSLFRWLMLASLLLSISIAWNGLSRQTTFKIWHNRLRHNTATIAHIQLMIGIWLYTQSAQVKVFFKAGSGFWQHGFFAVIHILLMLTAIVLITMGSALAKRKSQAADKYRTMMLWFSAALILILLAIPWPFSPLAQRPFIRGF